MKGLLIAAVLTSTAVPVQAGHSSSASNAGLWLAIAEVCGDRTDDIVLAYMTDAIAEGESQWQIKVDAARESQRIERFVKAKGTEDQFCANGRKDAALLRTDEGVDTCPNPALLRCPATPELSRIHRHVARDHQ